MVWEELLIIRPLVRFWGTVGWSSFLWRVGSGKSPSLLLQRSHGNGHHWARSFQIRQCQCFVSWKQGNSLVPSVPLRRWFLCLMRYKRTMKAGLPFICFRLLSSTLAVWLACFSVWLGTQTCHFCSLEQGLVHRSLSRTVVICSSIVPPRQSQAVWCPVVVPQIWTVPAVTWVYNHIHHKQSKTVSTRICQCL